VLAVKNQSHGIRYGSSRLCGAPLPLGRRRHNTPAVDLPIANHDDNQHAADDNLRLQNPWDGIVSYAVVFGKLEGIGR
jgi:hypothetical protein